MRDSLDLILWCVIGFLAGCIGPVVLLLILMFSDECSGEKTVHHLEQKVTSHAR